MELIIFIFKVTRKIIRLILNKIHLIITLIQLKLNRVDFKCNIRTNGVPIIDVHKTGKLIIGKNFRMNNGTYHNKIGRQQRCYFIVSSGANLVIGDNVGISSTALICKHSIKIGDNVLIGGNTVIYDTDFHSLNINERCIKKENIKNVKVANVVINNNVFIGAHSTILKGVEIGKNSIIGACSVVTKNIPENQIWAGNPIKFIKKNK